MIFFSRDMENHFNGERLVFYKSEDGKKFKEILDRCDTMEYVPTSNEEVVPKPLDNASYLNNSSSSSDPGELSRYS